MTSIQLQNSPAKFVETGGTQQIKMPSYIVGGVCVIIVLYVLPITVQLSITSTQKPHLIFFGAEASWLQYIIFYTVRVFVVFCSQEASDDAVAVFFHRTHNTVQ